MPLESMGSHIDEWPSLKDSPKYLKKLDERIDKIEKDEGHYKQLVKVNDVLNVLDFPDNKEEAFRIILEKQNQVTLKELAWKSKNEILLFIANSKEKTINHKEEKAVNIEAVETENQNRKIERIEQKISKIKSILTPEILQKHQKINEALEKQDIQKIIDLLKANNGVILKDIIGSLGWADKNNPKYLEFKDSLVWLDSSFESYFDELENIDTWSSLNTNDVISEIENESWWLVNIDLDSNKPMSKMSLSWSEYSFDEEIDKQALNELMSDSDNKMKEVQNSFAILKGAYAPFDSFINEIKKNWWKVDLKENIQNATSNFSREIFNDLWDVYKDMGINSDIQINESDITSLKDVKTPNELKTKIETIKDKLLKIKTQVWETQAWILKDYKQELKELVKRKEEAKEKQLEVLEFMKNSWFDLIPKDISNRIIKELQSNTLTIPWLELNRNNIDLKNWHFGESWAFVNKEGWINIESKRNLVKFVNKIISWDINEPSSVEAIVNGTSVSNVKCNPKMHQYAVQKCTTL